MGEMTAIGETPRPYCETCNTPVESIFFDFYFPEQMTKLIPCNHAANIVYKVAQND